MCLFVCVCVYSECVFVCLFVFIMLPIVCVCVCCLYVLFVLVGLCVCVYCLCMYVCMFLSVSFICRCWLCVVVVGGGVVFVSVCVIVHVIRVGCVCV